MNTTTTKKVPELRFPEFSGEWQTIKLGDFIDSLDAGVSVNSEDRVAKDDEKAILKTSCVTKGTFDCKENKVVTDSAETRRLKESIEVDTIIISRMNTPQLVGANALVHESNENIFLPDRLWAAKIKTNASPRWIALKLGSKSMRAHLSVLATGTSNSMKNVTKGDVLNAKILAPSREEQKKIAGFLGVVDERVAVIDKKVELLKKYRKGVMQKIFPPANGQTPKIRFSDENGKNYPDWQGKKLGDILAYEQPTKYIVKSTEYDDKYKTPVLTAGKTFILGYTDEEDGINNDIPVIIFDDFTTASHFVDFPFKVKSSAMKILRTKTDVNIKVAYELLSKIKFVVGDHKRHWIGEFQDFAINLPSEKEQQKIADFLTNLDDKINVVERQLEQAKNFKKSLLQQMFV
ncbi:hypothetical protein A3F37_00180 [Candidatus Saccharibacteria bacterium RIFCSPHIGHO2_12_FULL_41_12]|nr:MAG: hypothetical protein A3F37_00180 [Candidatus Saccharibacteria bacterium RIFCSPHIGHO2_12_FULL_41_12]